MTRLHRRMEMEISEERQMDAAIAEGLGLEVIRAFKDMRPGEVNMGSYGPWYRKGQEWHDVPAYSTDIAASFEMEVELERQGLSLEYAKALYELTYRKGLRN